MPASTCHLLLIDDDAELGELLSAYLGPEGFVIEAVESGERGIERALHGEHELIVLDVMLPGVDGFEVLRRIRDASAKPVLMLTARGEDIDRIVGLELGADDYLPKPFNPRELCARIKAVLRRVEQHQGGPASPARGERLVVDDVELDLGSREVRRDGELVSLTSVEFELLAVLLRAAGTTVDRRDLFRAVLDRDPDPLDRSIDMHVSHLRKKLGPQRGGGERIKAVRGVGYVYPIPRADAEPTAS
ncbi:MAG: response regulator transcription factor [Phycisphaerae bacterium]